MADRATDTLLMRINENLTKIEGRLESLDKISYLEEEIEKLNCNFYKLAKVDDVLQRMEDVINDYDLKMQDREAKLKENTLLVNQMTLELKGVIAQSRSLFSERKEFSK